MGHVGVRRDLSESGSVQFPREELAQGLWQSEAGIWVQQPGRLEMGSVPISASCLGHRHSQLCGILPEGAWGQNQKQGPGPPAPSLQASVLPGVGQVQLPGGPTPTDHSLGIGNKGPSQSLPPFKGTARFLSQRAGEANVPVPGERVGGTLGQWANPHHLGTQAQPPRQMASLLPSQPPPAVTTALWCPVS